jgi:3-hydroxybutyrate dehydrogenase
MSDPPVGSKAPLDGRVALVTGSTGGIGSAIARRLHREGATVVLHGFGEIEDVTALRKEIGARGEPATWLTDNLGEAGGGAALVRSARERLGSLDILVNNAGIQHVAPLEEFTDEAWESVMAIDLRAPFEATREALGGMYEAGWGRIINICSSLAVVAEPRKAAYVAAKHGLLGLTKVTALEAAQRGVTCNAICPGWVLTPMVENQIAEGTLAVGQDELDRMQPIGRFVRPEEIATAVAFLAGEEVGGITGSSISVDGGGLAG